MKPVPEIGSKIWQVEVYWRAPRNPQVHIHYCGPVVQTTPQIMVQGSREETPRPLPAREFTLPPVSADQAGKGRGHFVFYAASMERARDMRRQFLRGLKRRNKAFAAGPEHSCLPGRVSI